MGYELVTRGKHYIGQCDKIRSKNGLRDEKGQDFWDTVMDNYKEIELDEFLEHVNPEDLLDEDETLEDYMYDLEQEGAEAFLARAQWEGNDIYFVATGGTNGFEWFWHDNKTIEESYIKSIIKELIREM